MFITDKNFREGTKKDFLKYTILSKFGIAQKNVAAAKADQSPDDADDAEESIKELASVLKFAGVKDPLVKANLLASSTPGTVEYIWDEVSNACEGLYKDDETIKDLSVKLFFAIVARIKLFFA